MRALAVAVNNSYEGCINLWESDCWPNATEVNIVELVLMPCVSVAHRCSEIHRLMSALHCADAAACVRKLIKQSFVSICLLTFKVTS
jgi:hypothetical protein